MGGPVKVIGITESGRDGLPLMYQEWIEASERLVGGERHLQFFPEFTGEKIALKSGLKAVAEALAAEPKTTVVLASGDPLFYGIGSYLATKMEVEIYPALSSIQEAFAKAKIGWQDAALLSVHGRSIKGLAQKIDGKKKVCLLTDEKNTPASIATYLLSFGIDEYEATVCEALGGPDEKVTTMSLSDLTSYEAKPLNVLLLNQTNKSPQWTLGIDDGAFIQRKPDKGLITKKEVRILSIAEMGLQESSIVWDIGTCTGSVAIEAARIARNGAVYAVEKNEADAQNCRDNMKKFRTDITLIHKKAPDGLEDFPDPDAIFIGGTGGEMRELLAVCTSRLRAGGRIVLNAATIETLYKATQTFKELGFTFTVTQAQISRSKPILDMTRFEGLNPIYIITARHKEENMS